MTWDLISVVKDIQFARPDNLTLLFLVLPIFIVTAFALFLKVRLRPVQTEGSRYPTLGTFKMWFILIASMVPIIIASSDPYLDKGAPVFNKGGVEVIFVIDYSSSMFLDDTGWVRINIATREIRDLISSQTIRKGDRVSLYVFGKTSFGRMPLANDINFFIDRINEVGQPASLRNDIYWGSDITATLTRIYQSLDRLDSVAEFGEERQDWHSPPKNNRFIILLTDGDFEMPDDTVEDDGAREALNRTMTELRKRNLKVYPIGIGTRRGASLSNILRDYQPDDYEPGLEEDLQDQVSALNISNLEYLVNSTNSEGPFLIEYVGGSVQGQLASIIDSHRSIDTEPTISDDREDLWPYFLMVGIFLFLMAILFH